MLSIMLRFVLALFEQKIFQHVVQKFYGDVFFATIFDFVRVEATFTEIYFPCNVLGSCIDTHRPPPSWPCLTAMAKDQSLLAWKVCPPCTASPRVRWSPCRPMEPLFVCLDTRRKVSENLSSFIYANYLHSRHHIHTDAHFIHLFNETKMLNNARHLRVIARFHHQVATWDM